jgi:type II secretory pathway pseudopilin PulG
MKATRATRGFTILELLIAATITVIIVVVLGSMFGSLGATTSRANQRIDTFRDARAALQTMSRDLANIVHLQPAAYFAIDTDLGGADVRQIDGLISLKNQPSGNPAPIGSDVCAVRYYCTWANNAYSLHRYFRDSSQTFKTLQTSLSSTGSLNYAGNLGSIYGGSGTDDVLAAYVWNLQVVAYDQSGNIIQQTNDVFGRPTTRAPYICDPSGTSTNPLPSAIEVTFDTISTEAARTLLSATSTRGDAYNVWHITDNANPNSTDKLLFQRLIQPSIYHFRTRIDLH